MISENTLRNLVSRALATTVRRTSKRRKSRNSGTEQLETRALLAVFTVTSTADTTAAGTLRNAIDQANTEPGDDEIKFDIATNGTEFDLGGTQFTITESLTITGNGADNTVIDAQLNSRIFDIGGSAVNVTISGVTLKNGRVAGAGLQVGGAILFNSTGILSISSSVLSTNSVDDTAGSDAYGGAVFVQGGSLEIFGSTVTGNTADWGGAIYANGNSDVSITSSNVDGNVASNDGGAIYAGFGGQGDVTITGSTLESNTAQKRGGAIRADNVTITGGSTVRLNSATTEGGAIHADGNVSVTNSTVSENTATTHGGAIHAGGNVTVTGSSTMSSNTANGNGGAIFSIGSTEVTNSMLANNSTTGDNHRGGAIHSTSGAVTISQSTLSGNSTAGQGARGGAIYTDSGAVTISQSTLSGNSTTGANAEGGAIYASSGAVTISQSTLSGNSTEGQSADGGAISAISGAVTISQSTLSGNSTEGTSAEGGAILAHRGAVTISQSTLTLNNADQSQGGAIFSYSSPVTIRNSIIAGNTGDGTAPDVRKSPDSGDAFTVTNSLIGRNNGTGLTATVGTTPGANGNLIGGDNAGAAINPQLGPLANNGGPTQTHALLATSPAINKGSNALAVDVTQPDPKPALTTDQRGNPFARIFDTTVDMGAVERFAGALVVSTNVDEADSNISSGDLSLREAILLANGSIGNNMITFAAGLSGTIALSASLGQLPITASLIINGNGATNTVIDAGKQGFRVIEVTGSASDVTLSGMTITGGQTTGTGGGINFDSLNGTLILNHSTLSDNSADIGGGMFNTGLATLNHSTLSGNSARRGGGIDSFRVVTLNHSTLSGNSAITLGGGILNRGTTTLNNSTVSGNTAGVGAGVYNNNIITLNNSTLSGNTGNRGGGIFNNGTATLNNSTISGNSANTSGGGFHNDSGRTATLNNSIVVGSINGGDIFGVVTGNFNLIGNPTSAGGLVHGTSGNIVGADDGAGGRTFLDVTMVLAPLAFNGGPTQTHALQINSPAFNRGNNALATGLTTDQRGSGFSRILFGIVDMGALESTVLDSPEGTTGADAFVLTYSATTTAGTVTVTISTGVGPVVNLGTFPMNSPLTINGLGGTDSVRIVSTTGADTITVNSSTSLTVNGAGLTLTGLETRTLAGAAGSDTYRFDADTALGSWTLDEAGGGTDLVDLSLTTTQAVTLNLGLATSQTINANLSLILGSATTFENAIGGSLGDTITGNTLANTLTGGPGNDTLNGLGGSDNLFGGLNNDTYVFGPAVGAEEDRVNEFTDQGIDTLTFATVTTGITLALNTNSIQSIHTGRTLQLNSGGTFENAIGGSAADTLTGNTLANTLTGGAGNDILTGGAGSDNLFGGLNDDTYVFGPATAAEADLVNEYSNQGTDTLSFAALTTNVILSLASTAVQPVHTLRTLKLNSGVTFENAIGGSGGDTLTGNTLNNVLTGGNGNDILNGAAGNDELLGGLANDTYRFSPAVGSEVDLIREFANQGTDTVDFTALTTAVTFSLKTSAVQPVHTGRTLQLNTNATFENLIGGSAGDSLTGNALNNVMTGNAGNDTLTGLGGSDNLFGGLNDDTYVFGAATAVEADLVNEYFSQGTDTLSFTALTTAITLDLNSIAVQPVHTLRTLKLNSAVTFENASGGSANDVLLGNTLENELIGGNGHNVLVGNDGRDILTGGTGRDILIGGRDLDTLNGGTNEDIIIGGRTTSDANVANLLAMQAEWISANSYATRITNLRAGVGTPPVSLKATINVLHDALGEDDFLTGGIGLDWFFKSLDDTIIDLFAGETVDAL